MCIYFIFSLSCTATILQLPSPKKTAVPNKTSPHVFGRPRRSDSTPATLLPLCSSPAGLQVHLSSRGSCCLRSSPLNLNLSKPNRHSNAQALRSSSRGSHSQQRCWKGGCSGVVSVRLWLVSCLLKLSNAPNLLKVSAAT